MADNIFDEFRPKPESNPFAEFAPTAAPAPAPAPEPAPAPKSGVVRRVLGDTAVDLGRGVVGLGEAVVGIANIPTFGYAGKGMEAIGYRPEETKEIIGDLYSPERKAANKRVEQAEGFVGTASEMLKNPSTIAGAVVESLPMMGGGGAVARGLGGVRALAGTRAGGVVGRAAIGEGVVGAGSAAEGMRQESDDGLLSGRQVAASLGTGVGTGLIGAGGGMIARRLGIADPDVALAGGTTARAAPGVEGIVGNARDVGRRMLSGAATEGVFEEMPQSMQEQMWQNFGNEDPLMQGVPEAAAAGLLTGAAMGGAFAATSRGGDNTDPNAPKGDAAPPPRGLLPAPDQTVQVDPEGVASTETQRFNAALDEARFAHEREDMGLTPDVNAARAGHPGAVPNTLPDGSPIPDPAAGPISRAANVGVGNGAVDRAAAEQAMLAQAAQAESAPAERPVLEGEFTRVPRGVDPMTGEVRDRDPETLKAYLRAQLDLNGRLPGAGALSRALGMEPEALLPLVQEVRAERRADLFDTEATNAAATGRPEPERGADAPGNDVEPGRISGEPARALDADAAEAQGAAGAAAAERAPADQVARRLPAELARAAPRYSYGDKKFTLSFESDADRAAYIAAQARPSKRDADYLQFAIESTGLDEAGVRARGAEIRESIKAMARDAEPGQLALPAFASGAEIGQSSAMAGQSDTAPTPGTALAVAASEAATAPTNDLPEPTEAQKESGNYKKGHARVAGLDISIENPAGSRRRPEWPPLQDHYGYIRGTIGKDKDHVDVFMTERAEDTSLPVFVVDQVDQNGRFDEHKVVMGTANEAEARATYLRNYEPGWTGLGSITQMTQDEFKAWVKDPEATKRRASRRKPNIQDLTKEDDERMAHERAAAESASEQSAAEAEPVSSARKVQHAAPGRGLPSVVRKKDAVAALRREAGMTVKQAEAAFDEIPREGLKEGTRPRAGVIAAIEAAKAPEASSPLANATAPEHVDTGARGMTVPELAETARLWREHIDGGGDAEVTRIFEAPKKGEVVRLANKAKVYHKDHGWMTVDEAKAQIDAWEARALEQGRDPEMLAQNSQKIVLSLFDLTGSWSLPWEQAGYQVYRFDIQDESTYEDPETGERKKIGDVHNMSVEFFNDLFGSFDGLDVHAILAACPCTDFAVSGARHFAAKDADGRTVSSVELVRQTLAAIEYFKPAIWAVENPVGRIEKLTGLPPWRLSFDPNHLGDPYTKKTLLWGRFNADLPVAPVEPTEGSKMHRMYGGSSMATKNARSATPEGFAYGFFMANNAIDHPVMAIANKYDRLDRSLIERAVELGITEQQIKEAVDDPYYSDMDDAAANAAIQELIDGVTPDPGSSAPESGEQSRPAEAATDDVDEEAAAFFGIRMDDPNGEPHVYDLASGTVYPLVAVSGQEITIRGRDGTDRVVPAKDYRRAHPRVPGAKFNLGDRVSVSERARDGRAGGKRGNGTIVGFGDSSSSGVPGYRVDLDSGTPNSGFFQNELAVEDLAPKNQRTTPPGPSPEVVHALGAIADGGMAETVLRNLGDAGARAAAQAMGFKFSGRAKAASIANNLGERSQVDVREAAEKAYRQHATPEQQQAREESRPARHAAANARAATREQEAELRRREHRGMLLRENGEPFKNEHAARKLLGELPATGEFAAEGFGIYRTDGGFALRRWPTSGLGAIDAGYVDQDTARRKRDEAREAYARENGLRIDEFGNFEPASQGQTARQPDAIDVEREEYEARRTETAKTAAGKAAATKRHRAERLSVLGDGWKARSRAPGDGPARHVFERKAGDRSAQINEGRFAEGSFEVTRGIRDAKRGWGPGNGGTEYFQTFEDAAAYAVGHFEPAAAPAPPPAAEAPSTETTAEASAPGTDTGDAGQELWYNRRNRSGAGLEWSDVEGLNDTLKVKEVVKSKVWPRPDYQQLVADGLRAEFAHLVKQVYDTLSTKPKVRGVPTDQQLQDYIETVGKVRDAVFDFVRNDGRVAAALNGAINGSAGLRAGGPVSLDALAARDDSMLDAVFPKAEGDNSRWRTNGRTNENNARANLVGGNKLVGALQVTADNFTSAIKAVGDGWPAPQAAWQRIYKIRQLSDGWAVSRSGRTFVRELPTRAAAEDAAKTHYEQARSTGEGSMAVEARAVEEAQRIGPAHRQADEDISSERLMETFGFRGVNFGNWMKGKSAAAQRERQLHLNHAYDALLDLADMTGLPPKALSLEGKLGLAFGAQGSGGNAAHFVPGVNEINLTRRTGAGGIAHEWAHALDHYFAVQAGEEIARSADPFLTQATLAERKAMGVRPEIASAFQKIVTAMQKRRLTEAEMLEREQRVLQRMQDMVDGSLAPLRKLVADQDQLRAGADAEQVLTEFDALAARLREGDLGEGRVATGRKVKGLRPRTRVDEEVSQTSGQLLGLLRDALGDTNSEFLLRYVTDADGRAAVVAYHAQTVAQREGHTPQTGEVRSDYLNEARALESKSAKRGQGKAYWSTPWELFARAFESYIIDGLAGAGRRSDYLSWPQMSESAAKAMKEMGLIEGDRYPRGEERARINEAFDTLLAEIRTEETPEGAVRLFSRLDPLADPTRPATPEQAQRIVDRITRGWGEGAPRVVVVADADGLPARAKRDPGYQTVEGFYDDEAGTVYLVAGNLRGGHDRVNRRRLSAAERVEQVLAHEVVGHYGIEAITGPELWASIGQTLERMRSNGRHAELFSEIDRRYRGANRAIAVREAVAVMAEKGVRNSVVDRVITAVRQFLRSLGMSMRFSDAELRQHIVAAARYVRGGARPRAAQAAAAPAGAFSRRGLDLNKQVPVVGIAGGAFGDTAANLPEARRAAQQYLRRLRDSGRKMLNEDTGWKIGLSAASIRELLQFDAEKLNMLLALPRITRAAILADSSAADRDAGGARDSIKAFHTLYAPVTLNGDLRIARLVVREDVNGTYAYDLQQSAVLNDGSPAEAGLRQAGIPRTDGGAGPFMTVGQLRDAVNAMNRSGWAMSRTPDPFYSALAEAVGRAQGAPKRGDAAAWKGWLDGAQRRGEFKQSERDWMGLDAWLEGRGQTTREELAGYVRANQVQVQDVVLGERSADERNARQRTLIAQLEREHGITASDDMDGGYDWITLDDDFPVDEWSPEAAALRDEFLALDAEEARAGGPTQYHNYVMPGGENYRELLLTLPNAVQREAARAGGETGVAYWNAVREQQAGTADEYRSNHFRQPNILAHVRFNERVDADGKRVLFIEEIQSDWHQAGRKKGYKEDTDKLRARQVKLWADADKARDVGDNVTADRLGAEADALGDRVRRNLSAVPDAPMKGTDEWAMLAFKRMVRWAAENGFERIAWTTGAQQADRYDMRKQLSTVRVSTMADGNYRVRAYDHNQNGVVNRSHVTPDELPGVIGKELAERAIRDGGGEFSGLDLRVGGEGMAAFYDRILPAAVNKWAKRLGTKVGRATINTADPGFDLVGDDLVESRAPVEVHALDITPDMATSALAGQPLFSRVDPDATIEAVDTALGGTPAALGERLKKLFRGLKPENLRENTRPAWLGALTLRHLGELGNDLKLKNVAAYADVVQQMTTDRNIMQEDASKTADAWEKFQRKDRRGADATANLMHDTTIAGVDPSQDYAPLRTGITKRGGDEAVTTESIGRRKAMVQEELSKARSSQAHDRLTAELAALDDLLAQEKARIAAYPALVQRFQALPEAGQRLYVEVRDAYERQSDKMLDALVSRIQALQIDDRQRAAMVSQVRQHFESARINGPYFPLQRFGDFWISAEDAAGNPSFTMYERVQDWEDARRDLPKQGFTIKNAGRKLDEARGLTGASSGFMADLENLLDTAGIDADTRDEVYQLYLRTLPELSVRKHQIHRKATAGYSKDALRAFSANMFHGSFQIARLRRSHELEAELFGMEKAVNEMTADDPDRAAKATALYNEAQKRHEWVMNPRDSKLASGLTSIGFAWYLGTTPAAALVNLSQTAIVTYPVLAARFGPGKAFTALSEGMGRAMRNADGNLTRGLSAEEQAAFKVWYESGAIDRSQAHNLAGLSETDTQAYSSVQRRAMEVISWMFHKAEVVNREATALAAFRLARAAGQSFNEATQYAGDVVVESHFDYCVDTETEALTVDGWKRYDQIRVGDIVLAVDASGRAVESPVTAVNVFPGAKQVIEFQTSRRFSMALTPNHDAVIQRYDSKRGWGPVTKVQARDLKNSHHVLRAPLAALEGREGIYGKDLAALLGWIAAEGWYAKFRNCIAKKDVRLAQSISHNPDHVETIRGILARIAPVHSEQKPAANGTITWTIGGDLRKRVLELMPEKLLTFDMLRTMTAEEMAAVLDAFSKGDGHRRGECYTIDQADHGLQNLHVLQAMATALGRTATLTPGGKTMILMGGQRRTQRTIAKGMTRTERVVDTVWCPTTAHGTWIARRRGAVFVTGNSNANRARWMQSNAAKVLLLFRQYSLNMTWFLWRNLYQSTKGESPEVRREARVKLGGVLGMTGIFAGALGMPLMSVMFGIANAAAAAFGGDDDEPWDAEVAFRNFLADMLGPDAARVIARGPVDAITGASISSRVSLNDLWFREPNRELEGKAMANYLLEQAAGPLFGGMLVNTLRGLQQVGEGHTWRGVETMMPKALKDGMKAIRYGTEGVNTLRGDPVIEDLGVGGALLQLAGFSPASLNDRYDAINAAKNFEQKILDRRSSLLNAYAMAWRAGDPDTTRRVIEKIRAFNAAQPEVAISMSTIRQSLQARLRYSSRAEGGVVLNPKLAVRAREQARFAE